MQIAEMKAFKSFYLHKHFFQSSIEGPSSLSFLSHRTLQLSFHLRSRGFSFRAEEPSFAVNIPEVEPEHSETSRGTRESPRVWTVFDPVSGGITTRRSRERSSELERDVGPPRVHSELERFEVERNYGKVQNANSGNGDENRMGLSDSDGGDSDSSREKPDRKVKKAYSVSRLGQEVGVRDVLGSKKKGKSKSCWVCENCGHSDGQWWGVCHSCNSAGTMKRFSEGESKVKVLGGRSWLSQKPDEVKPMRLIDVNCGISQQDWRIPLSGLFGNEVARVLGGGLVPGSLVLIGGDPGIGKSTLVLQMAAMIAEGDGRREPAPVVYVSGEESVEQIKSRADRVNIQTEELFLYTSTNIKDILEKTEPLSPRALVVDSIQTVYINEIGGSAGGVMQVKECTSALLRFSKETNIPIILVGHVTKSGEIAGPRLLEHIVDVVLYLEGEKHSSHRLLRSVKNRFGSTDELGVFEMSPSGLQGISSPSEMFLSDPNSDSEVLAGLAVAVMMDGSRAFLIEIQALCLASSTVSRHVNGIQASRADMIISVLMKQAGLKIQENAVFLNVVSGVTLTETAGDLAIAAAICSSFLEFPIPSGVAFIGEIGLGGELHTVPRMDKRASTLAKLGYKTCIVPELAKESLAALDLDKMKIVGCKNLKEVINTVFRRP